MFLKKINKMQKSLFHIKQMDCPSEENLIRMKLQGVPSVHHLDFNIAERKLTVYHNQDAANEIERLLSELKLGSEKILTETSTATPLHDNSHRQRKVLIAVLAINAAFFVVEIVTGFISRSMGLVADSLDMLADALVYAISLYAVGKTAVTKKNVAKLAGYFQMILAAIGFVEVVRRFLSAQTIPDSKTMIIVSIFALIANSICLYLLQRSKDKEAHMQASMIFTSNDIIINSGVIVSGILVWSLQSGIPDLVIGSIVFLIVMRGAFRILALAK